MKSFTCKSVVAVTIFFGLLILLYLLIGGDKARWAFYVFSLPWSVLFEVYPYATGLTPFQIFLSDNYGYVIICGLLLNGTIVYLLSLLLLNKRHKSNE